MQILKWVSKINVTKRQLLVALVLIYPTIILAQKTVRYDLYVRDTLVNFAGKFKRAIAVNGQIPGTGLGLAIVKKIIEQHGGRINIESEINKGTTVHIGLPVFVSGIDQLVLERRLPVLEKAIKSLTNAPLDQLRGVAHEMGGAISFYTFETEGAKLIDFSHWLEVSPDLREDEIIARRDEMLISLRTTLLKIELGLSH